MQCIALWARIAFQTLALSVAIATTALDAAQKPAAPKDRPPAKRKATDPGRAPTHADVKYGPAGATCSMCGWPSPTSRRRCWFPSMAEDFMAAPSMSLRRC